MFRPRIELRHKIEFGRIWTACDVFPMCCGEEVQRIFILSLFLEWMIFSKLLQCNRQCYDISLFNGYQIVKIRYRRPCLWRIQDNIYVRQSYRPKYEFPEDLFYRRAWMTLLYLLPCIQWTCLITIYINFSMESYRKTH